MFDKVIFSIITGIIGSLLANWITATWTAFNGGKRLVASIAAGLATALLLFFLRRPKQRREALSDNVSKGELRAEGVRLTKNYDRVLSGNKGGDIIMKDISDGGPDERIVARED